MILLSRIFVGCLVVFIVSNGNWDSWASVPGCWGSGGVPWGWWGSSVSGGSDDLAVSLLWLWWVDSLTFVLDVGDESTVVVGLVGNGLDTAVGKVDTVRS